MDMLLHAADAYRSIAGCGMGVRLALLQPAGQRGKPAVLRVGVLCLPADQIPAHGTGGEDQGIAGQNGHNQRHHQAASHPY